MRVAADLAETQPCAMGTSTLCEFFGAGTLFAAVPGMRSKLRVRPSLFSASVIGMCLLPLMAGCGGPPETQIEQDEIRDGTIDRQGLYRNVVRVHAAGGVCTGVAVTRRRVLTAAHCFDGLPSPLAPNSISVLSRGRRFFSNNYRVHPGYIPGEIRATRDTGTESGWVYETSTDLAVIIFNRDLNVNGRALVDDLTPNEGTQATIVGYGEFGTGLYDGVRRIGTVEVERRIPLLAENNQGRIFGGVPGATIVMAPGGGNDNITCSGDSGGVIVNQARAVLGITVGGLSNSDGDCGATSGASAISVSPFVPWILNNASRYQNPNNRFDVNGDGFVSPIDALFIINALNNLSGGNGRLAGSRQDGVWLDTNADGYVSPRDALNVINQLGIGSAPDLGVGQGAAAPQSWGSLAYMLEGDANGDGCVNSSDLIVVYRNYRRAVTGGPAEGDVTLDGRVNSSDLVKVRQAYNQCR